MSSNLTVPTNLLLYFENLITNDDGFLSESTAIMLEHLSNYYECLAITPSSNMSGSSNSLTLKKPLLISKKTKSFYHINGSPADCIHISRLECFNFKPDLVISGINNGFNLGTDIFYSGTVAGAREGLLHRIPSISLSADYDVESSNYYKISKFVHEFIVKNQPIFIDMHRNNYFLNFNFPTKLNFNKIKITNMVLGNYLCHLLKQLIQKELGIIGLVIQVSILKVTS